MDVAMLERNKFASGRLLSNVVDGEVVLGFDLPDGGYWMPLFITVPPDADVPAIKERVVAAIRAQLSPRHVPDEILDAPAVPRTLTGKRLEVPVKRVMLGAIDPSTAISRGTLVHAESLEWYADQGRRTVQPRLAPPEAG